MKFDQFYKETRAKLRERDSERIREPEVSALYFKLGGPEATDTTLEAGIEAFMYGINLGSVISMRGLMRGLLKIPATGMLERTEPQESR